VSNVRERWHRYASYISVCDIEEIGVVEILLGPFVKGAMERGIPLMPLPRAWRGNSVMYLVCVANIGVGARNAAISFASNSIRHKFRYHRINDDLIYSKYLDEVTIQQLLIIISKSLLLQRGKEVVLHTTTTTTYFTVRVRCHSYVIIC
jgi:hypothetical protein